MMQNNPDDVDTTDDFERPSKSQRKREALALQRLGEQLVNLNSAQLAKMPLPEELQEAIRAAQGMTQRGARRRQLQYIGKLMRRIDVEPVHEALARR